MIVGELSIIPRILELRFDVSLSRSSSSIEIIEPAPMEKSPHTPVTASPRRLQGQSSSEEPT
jgi:hypothetical protein